MDMTSERDKMYAAIKAVLPEGWQVWEDIEGGQPNGAGTIEESHYREWFEDDRESHHRITFTVEGPWLDGPRPHIAAQRERDAIRKAEQAEESKRKALELQEAEEYQALTAVAMGMYGAHRLRVGLENSAIWAGLPTYEQDNWRQAARTALEDVNTERPTETITTTRSAEEQADTIEEQADHG